MKHRLLVWLRNSLILAVFAGGGITGYLLHPPTVNTAYNYTHSCIPTIAQFIRVGDGPGLPT